MTPVTETGAQTALPVGSVLIHLGPYKTGTTAIQSALHQHRADLRAHGVLYPGTARRQVRPVFALTGRTLPGIPEVPAEEWDAMVREIEESDATRTVLSSEDFVRATPEHLDRIVADFGRERVCVLMVARPLDGLLPSAWQQRVKSIGETRPYDEWLREVLDESREGESARTFWRNQGTPELAAAWARVVPPEQVTVVVADRTDRGQLRGVVEALLGLPAGLLTEGPQDNSSLTWERVELYRRVNALFKEHDWDRDWQRRVLHGGVLRALRDVPQGTEAPIPAFRPWAADRVAALGAGQADALAASGVRIVGDLDWLRVTPEGRDDVTEPDTIPIETVTRALEGLLHAMAAERRRGRRKRRDPAPTGGTGDAATRTLVGELGGRLARRVGRRPA